MAETQTARGSITRRFNLSILAVYALSIAISAPTIYLYTRHEVYQQSNTQLRMLVDIVKSIKGYVGTDLRPYFLKQGLFHTAGMSGIVAISRVAENFKGMQQNYSIRNVSDNPLNAKNSPQPLERDVLQRFRSDRDLREVRVEGLLDGQQMLVRSAPIVSKKGCLRCHGEPSKVPAEVTAEYGRGSGYHYKVGDVVGLEVVGVPIADIDSIAMQRSLIAIGLLTLLFALVFVAINLLVRRNLISPMLQITETAHAIAKGRLDQPLNMPRDDEIGDLARSVELLRRSFAQLMKRMRKGGMTKPRA
ncbi:MAG: DUF3365 domain-containing protein [Gammaproteobacteria bacterium]|nr:DUF3365 domain-containing protein [Gammaproteobacteria bacterium]